MAIEPKKPQAPAGNSANRRPRPASAKGGIKPDPRNASRGTNTPDDQEAELKKKLARRMAFAAVLIAVLLGALALFDQLTGPAVPVSKTPEVLPPKEVTQPVKPAEPAAGVAKEATQEVAKPVAVPEESAVPTEKGAPPPPAPAAEPSPVVKAPAAPAVVKPAVPAPAKPQAISPPHSLPITRPIAPVLPLPKTLAPPGRGPAAQAPATALSQAAPVAASNSDMAGTPPSPPTTPLPPARPLAPAHAASPAPTARPAVEPAVIRPAPAAPRLFSGFVLQAGVFSSTQRAEELYAKLQLNGIPATLETRVSVGPFNTREEADAARQKMKELGIDSVLLAPKGARK